MKSSTLILFLALVFLFISACSEKKNTVLSVIPSDDGPIMLIYFDLIPPEIKEIKLSEIINDFQIIPLETKQECSISNTWINFSKDFIFVGTQNYPGAAKLYRFDKNGLFLNELGKAGRGPGEHLGSLINVIRSYEDNNCVLVKWGDSFGEKKPQIFRYDGSLLYEIHQPFEIRNIERWSDSIWFSTGAFAGDIKSPVDSFAIIFYNNNGEVLKQIPRREYLPKNSKGYYPSPWNPSLYRFDDQWRLYMQGNDTVFKLLDMKLIPTAVLIPDQNALKFNKSIPPEELVGKYTLGILTETSYNLFINKEITIKTDIKEYQPGRWGGSSSGRHQLIIVDKSSKKAINANLTDDIFKLFPNEFLSERLKWQDNRMFIALQATALAKLIKDLNENTITDPDAKKLLEKLRSIPVDNNPIIFSFSLKDRFRISDN